MYTVRLVEALNIDIRKKLKTMEVFPAEDTATKLIHLTRYMKREITPCAFGLRRNLSSL